jgi:hypothetical protein
MVGWRGRVMWCKRYFVVRRSALNQLAVKQSAHCVLTGLPPGDNLYPVYEARRKPRAEAIIYIDYRHACRAGIKHSQ